MNQSSFGTIFDILAKQGINITPEYKLNIENRVNQIANYQPRIGVFGKTGAGKSSLCNAVFGRDVCPISDVKACTRKPQEVFLSVGNKGLVLLDVPGVGESGERDEEYTELYKELLPELDLVLWVIKGDDRAFSSDEKFYKDVVRQYIKDGKPFFIVINQIDKIEPFREWDEINRRPGVKQAHNIDEKRKMVSGFFELPLNKILAVSANERYGLVELVDSIIDSLPKEKMAPILDKIPEEYRSQASKEKAKDGFLDTIISKVIFAASPLSPVLSAVLVPVIKGALKVAGGLLKKLFSWF